MLTNITDHDVHIYSNSFYSPYASLLFIMLVNITLCFTEQLIKTYTTLFNTSIHLMQLQFILNLLLFTLPLFIIKYIIQSN